METAKKLSLVFLTLLVTGSAMSAVQHHPFSEIFPPDTNLDFGGQAAENVSRVQIRDGFVLDGFSLRDQGNNHVFRLDSSDSEFEVKSTDINMTGNNIEGSGNITSTDEMCIGKYC